MIDALVNLGLGVWLWLYPPRLAAWFELPKVKSRFFPSVLGPVLFGVGLALVIE